MEGVKLFYTSFQSHTFAYFFGALFAMRLIKRKKAPSPSSFNNFMIIFMIIFLNVLMLLPIELFETADGNEVKSLKYLFWFTVFFAVIIQSQSMTVWLFSKVLLLTIWVYFGCRFALLLFGLGPKFLSQAPTLDELSCANWSSVLWHLPVESPNQLVYYNAKLGHPTTDIPDYGMLGHLVYQSAPC